MGYWYYKRELRLSSKNLAAKFMAHKLYFLHLSFKLQSFNSLPRHLQRIARLEDHRYSSRQPVLYLLEWPKFLMALAVRRGASMVIQVPQQVVARRNVRLSRITPLERLPPLMRAAL